MPTDLRMSVLLRSLHLVADHPEKPGVEGSQRGLPHAHDGLFRLVFGKPVHAASELRAVLPSELAARLDLDGLTAVDGSFVDSALRWRHSDVLLSTRLDGRAALVYVLIEHQSKSDPLMPLRMLRYLVRIWDRHLKEHPKVAKLPLIVPIVVHQGRRPWSSPVELCDLIDVDPVTAAVSHEFLPRFRFLLDDLARIDETELRARPLTPAVRLTLLVMRAAPRRTDVAGDLERSLDTLADALHGPDGTEILQALLAYIHSVTETSAQRLHEVMARLGPEGEEVYMTTADMLRAEGRAETLAQLLTLRFGALPDSVRARLREASTQQLTAWTERVLSATSLDEVFT